MRKILIFPLICFCEIRMFCCFWLLPSGSFAFLLKNDILKILQILVCENCSFLCLRAKTLLFFSHLNSKILWYQTYIALGFLEQCSGELLPGARWSREESPYTGCSICMLKGQNEYRHVLGPVCLQELEINARLIQYTIIKSMGSTMSRWPWWC
jgi:hypothetical protein